MRNDAYTAGLPEDIITKTLWLNARAMGLALGLLTGAGLFLATLWLVIKGGDPVGPHLQLLGQYFPGYRVSTAGSLIGLVYGFLVGYASGISIGFIYNRIVFIREGRKTDSTAD